MELFSRDMVLAGPPADVRTWAVDIAAAFEQATGRHVNTWACIAGGTPGHYSWGYQVDGNADALANGMKAMEDSSYLAKIEEGRQFFDGPGRDTLYRAYTELAEDQTRVGNVAQITQANAKAGSLGHAVGWGMEVSDYVARKTGMYNVLLSSPYGSYSQLTWMGIAKDATQADEADRMIRQDDEYLKLIARGGDFFQDGSGHTSLFLRVG